MPTRIQCVVVNATQFALVPTLSDGAIEHQRVNHSHDGGRYFGELPTTIASGASGQFEVDGEGWACYELVEATLVVRLGWDGSANGAALNGFYVSGNQYASSRGELEVSPVTFATTAGAPLSFPSAMSSPDTIVATFTVKLKTLADGSTPTTASPILATPNGSTTVVAPVLPAWAQALSPPRRKMLASLAKLLPQSVHGAGAPPYGQGGTMISSDGWWQPDSKMTSCTSFNPKVIAVFFGKDSKDVPFSAQWGFATGGSPAFTQKLPNKDGSIRIVNNPKRDPQPGWKLFKDNPNELPKPGDTYNLWADYATPSSGGGTIDPGMRHVGLVVYAPDENDPDDCWVTGDGGQGTVGNQRCELVWMRFIRRAPRHAADAPTPLPDPTQRDGDPPRPDARTPHVGGGMEGMLEPLPRLYGWVNLEDPSLADYDKTPCDADFRDVVARIEKVRAWFKAERPDQPRAKTP